MHGENHDVRSDEYGVRRMGNSRVMLEAIGARFLPDHSPATLQQQYPALRLEDVYGAITYGLAHTAEVPTSLTRPYEVWRCTPPLAVHSSTLRPLVPISGHPEPHVIPGSSAGCSRAPTDQHSLQWAARLCNP
jgi:hypothetical protein